LPGHASYLDKKNRILYAGDDVSSDVSGSGPGPDPATPNGQFANLTVYRDQLTRLVAHCDEYDYLFPGHFIVNLENSVLICMLETLNEIIANPEGYDYKTESMSGRGVKQERMYRFVKGFGTVAYTQNDIYPSRT
jgi:glyoxylase-like metal-dependent hydrolase (beta-lactamase superfamily II)